MFISLILILVLLYEFMLLHDDNTQLRAQLQDIKYRHSPFLRTHSNTKGWKIVDWSNPISQEESNKFSCAWTKYKSSSTKKTARMCVHDFDDRVSNVLRKGARWIECDILPELWKANAQNKKSVYIDIGANIGSCVMEMLLETDAKIIAFEPHPMNLFNLKKTISDLGPSFQNRVSLFPIGLGSEEGTFTIYSGHDNLGNSVIGTKIPDYENAKFSEEFQFEISVDRLDSLIRNDIDVRLVKMDAQGYECHVLEGMGKGIASNIDTIKFEWAAKWLQGLKCTDLMKRFREYGFVIFQDYNAVLGFHNRLEGDSGRKPVVDLFATRRIATKYVNR